MFTRKEIFEILIFGDVNLMEVDTHVTLYFLVLLESATYSNINSIAVHTYVVCKGSKEEPVKRINVNMAGV